MILIGIALILQIEILTMLTLPNHDSIFYHLFSLKILFMQCFIFSLYKSSINFVKFIPIYFLLHAIAN